MKALFSNTEHVHDSFSKNAECKIVSPYLWRPCKVGLKGQGLHRNKKVTVHVRGQWDCVRLKFLSIPALVLMFDKEQTGENPKSKS